MKSFAAVCCCLFCLFMFSAGVSAETAGSTASNTGFREELRAPSALSPSGLTYTSPFMFDSETGENLVYSVPKPVLSLGIDVSGWQGTIDWPEVAAAGVEFALIRVGHHNGFTNLIEEDRYFRQNIEGAKAAGIRVGVYIYSQAITEDEAREEAAYVIRRVAGYELDLPVVFDFEYERKTDDDGTVINGRLYQAYEMDKTLDKAKATDICLAFCDYVSSFGYSPMVYANAWMLTNRLNADVLEEKADLWMANYTQNTVYQNDFDYWQYSSSGRVSGIQGNVDCDFAFTDKLYQSGKGCYPFTDVSPSAWYYEDSVYVYNNNLFSGTAWNQFSPDTEMSRAMLVAVLYRMEGNPASDGSTAFTDLKDDWYRNAVSWAEKEHIVYGVSETAFSPDDALTREQLAVILYRYAAWKGFETSAKGETGAFLDEKEISPYAADAVSWAVGEGYISGFPGNVLAPRENAPRCQVAAITARFCRNHNMY
ncbi:MAG: GH25 family lysozyme [Clostridia bacterium]